MAAPVQPLLLTDTDTVTLPRTTLRAALRELDRGLTSSGHRAQIVTNEFRGHCPTNRPCTPGCHAYVLLIHEVMDALGMPR